MFKYHNLIEEGLYELTQMTSRGITKPRLAYFRSYRDKRILRHNTILPMLPKALVLNLCSFFWLQAATVPRALTMPSQSFFHPSPSRRGTPPPWLVQLHPHPQAAHPFPCILSRHLVSKTVVVASPSWLRAMCSQNLIPYPSMIQYRYIKSPSSKTTILNP